MPSKGTPMPKDAISSPHEHIILLLRSNFQSPPQFYGRSLGEPWPSYSRSEQSFLRASSLTGWRCRPPSILAWLLRLPLTAQQAFLLSFSPSFSCSLTGISTSSSHESVRWPPRPLCRSLMCFVLAQTLLLCLSYLLSIFPASSHGYIQSNMSTIKPIRFLVESLRELNDDTHSSVISTGQCLPPQTHSHP